MLFNRFNWMDIENYLEQDNRVVVITGACEQHAYLSLTTDINTPLTLAQVVCDDANVLIAPPLPYGISPGFEAYPGTISVSEEAFAIMLTEVLSQLIQQGFTRILLSNGHGGNTAVLNRIVLEVSEAHDDAKLDLFEWFRDSHVLSVAQRAMLPPNHANWFENLPFNRVQTVREMPTDDKPAANLSGLHDPKAIREVLGDGNFGGPYQADDTIIEAILNVAAESMAIKLRLLAED